MGWGNILSTIAGVAAAPFTGGASLIPSLISAGASVGQAALSSRAEKNAAKQQMAGSQEASQTLSPYNTLGLQSANTLAGLLGLPGLPGGVNGGGAPPTPLYQQPNRAVASTMQGTTTPVESEPRMAVPRRGATLASIRRGPTSGGSSYRANPAGSRF